MRYEGYWDYVTRLCLIDCVFRLLFLDCCLRVVLMYLIMHRMNRYILTIMLRVPKNEEYRMLCTRLPIHSTSIKFFYRPTKYHASHPIPLGSVVHDIPQNRSRLQNCPSINPHHLLRHLPYLPRFCRTLTQPFPWTCPRTHTNTQPNLLLPAPPRTRPRTSPTHLRRLTPSTLLPNMPLQRPPRQIIPPPPPLHQAQKLPQQPIPTHRLPTPQHQQLRPGPRERHIHPPPIAQQVADVARLVAAHQAQHDDFLVAALEAVRRVHLDGGPVPQVVSQERELGAV